jgi:hypothetical protein
MGRLIPAVTVWQWVIKKISKIFRLFISAILPPLIFLVLFFAFSMFIYKNLEKDITWVDTFFWITHPHAISEHRKAETKIFALVVYVGILFFQVGLEI